MAKFVMMGNYTQASMEDISASRTERAEEVIRANGGDTIGIYALLGASDLMLIVDLPDVETAMRVSLELTRLTGVGFQTSPAVDVAAFDALASGRARVRGPPEVSEARPRTPILPPQPANVSRRRGVRTRMVSISCSVKPFFRMRGTTLRTMWP